MPVTRVFSRDTKCGILACAMEPVQSIANLSAVPPQRSAAAPRILDIPATIDHTVHWLATQIADASRLLVPLSGTDSALTFILTCEAAKRLPFRCPVLGIHYGDRYLWKEQLGAFGSVEVRPLPKQTGINSEYLRWALLQTEAWSGTNALDEAAWIVGTRNRSEQQLGKYSQSSRVVSLLPIVHLWKSEVLACCRYLGLPPEMVHESRCADNECGRPAWMAEELEAIDHLLMIAAGELDPKAGEAIRPDLKRRVQELLTTNGFKGAIPYRPDQACVVEQR